MHAPFGRMASVRWCTQGQDGAAGKGARAHTDERRWQAKCSTVYTFSATFFVFASKCEGFQQTAAKKQRVDKRRAQQQSAAAKAQKSILVTLFGEGQPLRCGK